LQALLTDVEVIGLEGDPTVDVLSMTHDSRRVLPGALFACIPGERTDGHEHAASAVEAGAVALLTERALGLSSAARPVSEARVPDVRVAVGPVAARLHGDPSAALSCLGVTGTNGKTTTTYLLEAIARATGRRVGVVGTTGARIDGHPLPVEHTTPEATELQSLLGRMRDVGVATVAMEVSSHALAQHRVDGTHFAAVCFTNLSRDHLDYHGDVETYFDAKARLFTPAFAATAAVNIDDRFGLRLADLAAAAGLTVTTFAVETADADIAARDVAIGVAGSSFTLVDERARRSALVRLPLFGRHNVANALAAAATARAVDLPFDAVVTGLAGTGTIPGRLEPIDAGQQFLVLVDYAHTPDALEHALRAARELADAHRVIVVFGCGGDRDRTKRPEMGSVATRGADVAILTSDNPRSERPADIADEVVAGAEGPGRLVVELDRRAAIRAAISDARSGDVVVIAGKGHETGQTSGGVTVPFDDRAVARGELEARSWS
jgi:UDP-N-acetylmuramoyl-L-alanyl-D-glutamate--2,6-diaminopimelate ligase